MELGGVSVPGLNAKGGGAYLVKDLTVFEAQLGGLKAFVMVSDGTADDGSNGAGSQLAVKSADAYLESVLRSIATGQTPVIDPVLVLKTIVGQANAAILAAAGEPDAASMGATFVGAMISAERAWLGSVGDGSAYLLRGEEARQLVVAVPTTDEAVPDGIFPDEAPTDGEVSDQPSSDIAASALGHEGVEIEVGSVPLNPGDAIVLCGRTASAILSADDIRSISCVACDAQVAAANLADAVGMFDLDHSATVAIWSADSALFTPAPAPTPVPLAPQGEIAPAAVAAAVSTAPDGSRAERIFLWTMSAWIALAFIALGAGIAYSAMKPPASPPAGSSASQSVVAATAAQEASLAAAASAPVPSEFPKKLVVPKKVKGGVWLRKTATTLAGVNEVAVLKGGTEVTAVGTTQGTDDKGRMQDFYVLRASDISAKQILKTAGHPWPPPKSVKNVYVFTGSLTAP